MIHYIKICCYLNNNRKPHHFEFISGTTLLEHAEGLISVYGDTHTFTILQIWRNTIQEFLRYIVYALLYLKFMFHFKIPKLQCIHFPKLLKSPGLNKTKIKPKHINTHQTNKKSLQSLIHIFVLINLSTDQFIP